MLRHLNKPHLSKELEPEPGAGTTRTKNTVSLDAILNTLSIRPRATIKTPVFPAHSQDDETVPFTHGEGLHQTIKHLGFDVTWKKYEDGGHWIHPEHGVDEMSAFMHKVLNI